ncbi:unnamed protein product [Peniophora sp. CBMAI 1063]|nr:unnamed protein product [Peniophora sp. CBMAI 1063]
MPPSTISDAEWASIDPKFRFEMKRLRRERDDIAAERDAMAAERNTAVDTAVSARARLQEDYDILCAEIQQAHVDIMTKELERAKLEKDIASTRAEATSLVQQLQEAHQENDDSRAFVESETGAALKKKDVKLAQACDREDRLVARLGQAEANEREAREKLVEARQLLEETRTHAQAELNDARTGRDQALSERSELEGIVADKDHELIALRKGLQEKQISAWTISAPVGPAPREAEGPEAARTSEDTSDTSRKTQVSSKSLTAKPQVGLIDLTLESDNEQPDRASCAPVKSSVSSSTSALTKAMSGPASTQRNATPGPGPSTLRNREKSAKRAREEAEPEVHMTAKRAKLSSRATQADVFDVDAQAHDHVPSSLRHRVEGMRSLALTQIPSNMLPTPDKPTAGWVKRTLLVKKWGARAKVSVTHLSVSSHLLEADDCHASRSRQEPPTKYPAVFLELDILHLGIPSRPGQPGLMITNREDIPFDTPILTFVCKESECLFIGRYIFKREELAVTQQEWKGMPQWLRRKWAHTLADAHKNSEHLPVALSLLSSLLCEKNVYKSAVSNLMQTYNAGTTYQRQQMRPSWELALAGMDKGYAFLGVITMEPISVAERLYKEIWDHRGSHRDRRKTSRKGKKSEPMDESS